MSMLYNFSIQLYLFAISIAAVLGKKKAKLWLNGRGNWREKLSDIPRKSRVVWFHAASLGEFEQARPLIEKVKKERPNDYVLLTFFSPSGYEVQKKYALANKVCYLPIDTPTNAKSFIQLVQPDLAVFVKYEFWFNYLSQLKKQRVRTILVSGIFRKSQHFFKFYGTWFRKKLKAFDRFYLQNDKSEELLNGIGFNNTTVVGDTRFDRVAKLAQEQFEDKRFESFSMGSKVVVFGSSWKEENEFAVELSKQRKNLKLIIAPHEINTSKIVQLREQFDLKVILFSDTKEDQDLSQYQVLIVDQIGLLSKIYRYADIAVIGGGFGSGIHNILEPAVYACPVLFGPNYHKFQEAIDLIGKKAAFSVKDKMDFIRQISGLIDNDTLRKDAAIQAKKFVEKQIGATDKIFEGSF